MIPAAPAPDVVPAAAPVAGSAWRAVAAFRQGERHRREGQPCEDYAAVRVIGDLLVGVVADGAGSARWSRLGAGLAVRGILSRLTAGLVASGAAGAAGPPDAAALRACFGTALACGLNRLRGAADARTAVVNDFACTVLALAATPAWAAALQIGDGLIVVRDDTPSYQLMFTPQTGEYVNETRFLTDIDAPAAARFSLSHRAPTFVCLATDGLTAVSIDFRRRRPHAPFFGPIETYLRGAADAGEARQAARAFLGSERLAQRSDDDRALLLAVRLDAAGAGG